MRKQFLSVLLALGAMGGLAACTPGTGTGEPTTTGTASESPASPGSTSTPEEPENAQPGTGASADTTPGSMPPDAETTDPAPAPPAPAPLPSGPGKGDVELAITVRPSEDGTAVNYTLVCRDGSPAAESQHPGAAAACAALKENAGILDQPGPRSDVLCTQQYGGPQVATVTGVVDGIRVETTFALRNGCEIGAWNAAKDVLGSASGAA
jgi:hypothetical protein